MEKWLLLTLLPFVAVLIGIAGYMVLILGWILYEKFKGKGGYRIK